MRNLESQTQRAALGRDSCVCCVLLHNISVFVIIFKSYLPVKMLNCIFSYSNKIKTPRTCTFVSSGFGEPVVELLTCRLQKHERRARLTRVWIPGCDPRVWIPDVDPKVCLRVCITGVGPRVWVLGCDPKV